MEKQIGAGSSQIISLRKNGIVRKNEPNLKNELYSQGKQELSILIYPHINKSTHRFCSFSHMLKKKYMKRKVNDRYDA